MSPDAEFRFLSYCETLTEVHLGTPLIFGECGCEQDLDFYAGTIRFFLYRSCQGVKSWRNWLVGDF